MLTKLTLSIDKDVIKKAKGYADENHISVSKMVEFYLRSFSTKDFEDEFKIPPITSKLLGMSKDNPRKSDKDILVDELLAKHLR